ncbi:MAG: galactokinase, partial [Cyclobacteriaceae bacterium]|nr:galactokinase [Cyclobacteriaceae bacterium]
MYTTLNELKNLFQQQFGEESLLVEAPGRINLIGEHTDYNEGFVLPAAIDKSVKFIIQPSGTSQCSIIANDLDEEYSFSLDEALKPVALHWVNYFLGVIDELKSKNHVVKGFNLLFSSDIPIGSGLSSSAAIECGFGYALNQLFDLGLSRVEIALIGQKAEHKFAGVKCGIMDQFASILGKEGHVMQLDCRTLEYTYFPANFADYQLVLFDTQVKHNLADSEYNIRRNQCEKGLDAIKSVNKTATSLRDVSLAELFQVQDEMDQKIVDRCKYIIEENERVHEVCNALKTKNIEKVGQ